MRMLVHGEAEEAKLTQYDAGLPPHQLPDALMPADVPCMSYCKLQLASQRVPTAADMWQISNLRS